MTFFFHGSKFDLIVDILKNVHYLEYHKLWGRKSDILLIILILILKKKGIKIQTSTFNNSVGFFSFSWWKITNCSSISLCLMQYQSPIKQLWKGDDDAWLV